MTVWGKPVSSRLRGGTQDADLARPATHRVRRTVTVALAGIMVVVPAVVAVVGSPPSRFGWQMYATVTSLPTAFAETEMGTTEEISINQLLARARPEVSYGSSVTAHLCEFRNDIVKVRFVYEPGREEVFQCGG